MIGISESNPDLSILLPHLPLGSGSKISLQTSHGAVRPTSTELPELSPHTPALVLAASPRLPPEVAALAVEKLDAVQATLDSLNTSLAPLQQTARRLALHAILDNPRTAYDDRQAAKAELDPGWAALRGRVTEAHTAIATSRESSTTNGLPLHSRQPFARVKAFFSRGRDHIHDWGADVYAAAGVRASNALPRVGTPGRDVADETIQHNNHRKFAVLALGVVAFAGAAYMTYKTGAHAPHSQAVDLIQQPPQPSGATTERLYDFHSKLALQDTTGIVVPTPDIISTPLPTNVAHLASGQTVSHIAVKSLQLHGYNHFYPAQIAAETQRLLDLNHMTPENSTHLAVGTAITY